MQAVAAQLPETVELLQMFSSGCLSQTSLHNSGDVPHRSCDPGEPDGAPDDPLGLEDVAGELELVVVVVVVVTGFELEEGLELVVGLELLVGAELVLGEELVVGAELVVGEELEEAPDEEVEDDPLVVVVVVVEDPELPHPGGC